MRVPSVQNATCVNQVSRQIPFKGTNLYGEMLTPDVYVVYSYGKHWPLFACIRSTWYENTDGGTASTNRHRTQARPEGEHIVTIHHVTRDELKRMLSDEENNAHAAAHAAKQST